MNDPYVSAYAYVNNRPTLFVDPSGLLCVLGSNPNGSCRGSGVVKRGGHVVRAVKNAPFTGAGAGWSAVHGGTCDLHEGLMVVCTGTNPIANGPAPALAVGNTVIADAGAVVDEDLLEHESVHSDQWAHHGWMFPGLYIGAYIAQGKCNVFEREAGFEAGNYGTCLGENRK